MDSLTVVVNEAVDDGDDVSVDDADILSVGVSVADDEGETVCDIDRDSVLDSELVADCNRVTDGENVEVTVLLCVAL